MVPEWADLTETRRSNLENGLRCAAKLARLLVSERSCFPDRLEDLLFERPPAAAGSGTLLSEIRALRDLVHPWTAPGAFSTFSMSGAAASRTGRSGPLLRSRWSCVGPDGVAGGG